LYHHSLEPVWPSGSPRAAAAFESASLADPDPMEARIRRVSTNVCVISWAYVRNMSEGSRECLSQTVPRRE
jgi:hypothetical protein